MLEILPSPDHVAAYSLSGTLTEEDYDRVIADLEEKLGRHRRIGILVDLTGFHDITLRAGAKDLRYSFSKLFQLHRFPREAVITDKSWIATLAQTVGPLVPFMEICTFAPGERVEALVWAGDFAPETLKH